MSSHLDLHMPALSAAILRDCSFAFAKWMPKSVIATLQHAGRFSKTRSDHGFAALRIVNHLQRRFCSLKPGAHSLHAYSELLNLLLLPRYHLSLLLHGLVFFEELV